MSSTLAPVRWAAALAAAALALAGCGEEQLRIEPPAAKPTMAEPRELDLVREPRPLDNIRNLDLRTTMLADPEVPAALKETVRSCRMCGLGDPVYVDVTKDRVDDVVAPIMGPNAWQGSIAYTVRKGRPKLVFAYAGAMADVRPQNGDLLLSEKLYAPDDAACCATGPTRVTRFTWNGHHMIEVSTTGDKKGFTPYDHETKVVH